MKAMTTCTALLAMLAGISGAQAETGPSGSAQRSTYRSCAGIADTAPCNGSDLDPRQVIVQDVYAGGIGNFGSANLDIDRPGTDNDAFARSTVSQGALLLPQIRAETRAGADDRMNINAFGFQTYSWEGTEATPFSLAATLHVVDSSVSKPDFTYNREQDGDLSWAPGYWLPGGAGFFSYVAIWDPAILTGLTTPQELIAKLFAAGCRTPGVLGYGLTGGNTGGGNLMGGEASSTITTGACSNGRYTGGNVILQPGQQVLTIAQLQLPVNRGGFVDATHTFTTMLDPTLSDAVRAGLAENLIPATAVPEPAGWALMIAGFALLGGTLRRRSGTALRLGFGDVPSRT